MATGPLHRGFGSTIEPSNIFRSPTKGLALDSDQTFAKKLANQLCYGRSSEAGKFYGYSGYGYGGWKPEFNVSFGWEEFTVPIYNVEEGHPTRRVYLVAQEGAEETLRGSTVRQNSLELLEVPVPLTKLLPHGQVQAKGTDATAYIRRPSTDESWQLRRLSQFQEGPLRGEWKATSGHYQANLSLWNGVCAPETGHCSASSLSLGVKCITHRDLLRVAYGLPIDHALAMSTLVTKEEHRAPAITNDSRTNTREKLEDNVTPNPAFGSVDAVPEGTWCTFPEGSHASDFGITRPLGVAAFEAIRDYGLVVIDGAGNCELHIQDPRSLYTKYGATVDPFSGPSRSQFEPYINEGTTAEQRAPYQAALPLDIFAGPINGKGGILESFPWRELQLKIAREA